MKADTQEQLNDSENPESNSAQANSPPTTIGKMLLDISQQLDILFKKVSSLETKIKRVESYQETMDFNIRTHRHLQEDILTEEDLTHGSIPRDRTG
jgi:hypothetical protein